MIDKTDERKKWWNNDLKFTLLFLLFGIIMGFVGFVINSPIRSFLVMIVVFIGSAVAVKRVWKISETKSWWFSKFIVYIFLWFVVWTIFHTSCSIYNMLCI